MAGSDPLPPWNSVVIPPWTHFPRSDPEANGGVIACEYFFVLAKYVRACTCSQGCSAFRHRRLRVVFAVQVGAGWRFEF